ncbi:MAG: hypothetical protein IK118_03455 [Clostridia bacterium]|nr:hypothetical protein [Clostridia bacterium]
MKNQHTLHRLTAVLLSLLLSLAMIVPAFALRGGCDTAVLYTDDLGCPAVNLPVTGSTELDLTDQSAGFVFKVYDDGGRPAYCTHDAKDGYLLITAPEGCVLQVSGSYNLKYTYGRNIFFNIYDGAETSADAWNMENIEWNTPRELGVLVSSGNEILIQFGGAELYTCAGLDLTVTIAEADSAFSVNVADAPHGSVAPDALTNQVGSVVSLSVTPDPGWALTSLSVKDANGDNVLPLYPYGAEISAAALFFGGTDTIARFDPSPLWYSGVDSVIFTMPASDVSVEYEMSPISEGLAVDLPAQGWGHIDIPATVQSFKLYDIGGRNGAMPNDGRTDVKATLTAPQNFYIQVSGTIDVYPREDCSLCLYDGATAKTTELLERTGADDTNDIGTVTSTGNQMFLFFYNIPDDAAYAGLDLTVTLIPKTEFALPEWTWADDCSSATAAFWDMGASVEMVDAAPEWIYTTEPTCTTDGVGHYEASVVFGGETYTSATEDMTNPGSATGHTYGAPVWSWNDDMSVATATFTCVNNDGGYSVDVTEFETVDVDEPTCEKDATAKHIAYVVEGENEYSDESDVFSVPGTALGHSYTADWTWNSDGSAVAKLTCFCGKTVTKKVAKKNMTEKILVEPTEESAGRALYTATVKVDGKKYSDSHEDQLPALPHTHRSTSEPVEWRWAEDYSSCEAIFVCDRDGIEYAKEATVEKGWSVGPDENGAGRYYYVATVIENEHTYSKFTVTFEVKADNVCKWCGKVHTDNFFQKILAFFHKIFAALFGAKY